MPIKFLNDVAVDTNVLYVDTSSDRVGIGTTSPDGKLNVVAGNNGTALFLEAEDGANPYKNITFKTYVSEAQAANFPDGSHIYTTSPGGATEWPFTEFGALVIEGRDNTNSGIALRTGDGAGQVTRIAVRESGNVGIGTTSPSQKLDVVGNIRSQFNSGDYSQLESNGSGGVIKALSSGSTTVLFRSYGDSYILNDLGIGTTSPDVPLHVYGTLKVEDTSTSTSSFAVIEMEGRGGLGSQTAYLRTDYNGNFSIADSAFSSSTTFRNTTLGNLISSNNSSNGNDSIFEATSTFGPSTDAVTMLFKANTDSQTGQYNEVGIEVDRMDGWAFSSTKRGKMRLQTGGNDHITMQTSVSETSSTSSTTFDQPCTFNGLSTGIGFFSGTTATFAGKVGVGRTPPVSKLDVNGGIRMADDTSTAASTNVGTLRYRTSGNNSYVDMCMQTGASTYAWVNIVQNSW